MTGNGAVEGNSKSIDENEQDGEALLELEKCLSKGIKHYEKKRYAQAIEKFTEAVHLKNDSWEAWYNLGLAYYHSGKKKNGLLCFLHALDNNDKDIDTLLNVGSLLREFNFIKEAARIFISALKIDPSPDDAWLALGEVFEEMKEGGKKNSAHALYCHAKAASLARDDETRNKAKQKGNRILKMNKGLKPSNPLDDAELSSGISVHELFRLLGTTKQRSQKKFLG